uniref:Uncharacterized protein n=1 Tax=Rhizophora mucronata TaxID=61149 RepID=A0A2P2LUM2_RHIMU
MIGLSLGFIELDLALAIPFLGYSEVQHILISIQCGHFLFSRRWTVVYVGQT